MAGEKGWAITSLTKQSKSQAPSNSQRRRLFTVEVLYCTMEPCISNVILLAVLSFFCWAGSVSALAALPVVFDSSNTLHRDLQYHPEQPARISETIKALVAQKRISDNLQLHLIDVAPSEAKNDFYEENEIDSDLIQQAPFTTDELDQAHRALQQTHPDGLVDRLEESCNNARERRIQEGKQALGHMGYMDPDTYATTETFNVCVRATAAWIKALELAHSSGRPAMALTRPPGHHATGDCSNGFCIFNFAAATAIHALQDTTKRVSILDFDVHYGQGVAEIIQNIPKARYVSIHQTPAFPYLGESLEVMGKYQNVKTIPIAAESSWTCGYQHVYQKALDFVSNPGEWTPDVVIVCAGYDALDSDELASCSLQAKDYGRMTELLIEHLEATTVKKRPTIMFGLEGGYQLSEFAGGGNLQQAILATLQAMT